jgi:molybdate transport system permease protein
LTVLSPAEWTALFVSLKVAALALVLVVVPGVPLAWLLARREFPGRSVLDALASLPLVLPPVVTGYVLLWLLAPGGPVGAWVDAWFDVRILFTWPAASLAAAVVSFPLFLRSLRAAIETLDPGLEEAAFNLGAPAFRVAWTITLPLARHGLVAGMLLAFSRALGEFGATILVAGNVPGRTQTVPLAIFSMTQTRELRDIFPLVLTVSILSFAMVLLSDRWGRRAQTSPPENGDT